MLVKQLVTTKNSSEFAAICERCPQFLWESQGEALLKNLPREYGNVHKVKARRRNLSNEFTHVFNQAFEDISDDLCQRAIFAHGVSSFQPSVEPTLEPFYIFPVDGYQYLYNSTIVSSSEDHKHVFEMVLGEFGPQRGRDIILDVFKLGYRLDNLVEGINCGAEIILFNIPFYYAVRASTYQYANLLTLIATHE